MPIRQVRPKKTTRSISSTTEAKGLSPARQKAVKKLQKKTGDLLDEIDNIIETNKESLKDYRQQGGE